MRVQRSLFAASLALVVSTNCFAGDLLKLGIAEAQHGHHMNGSPVALINVRLTDQSRKEFAKWTTQHVRQKMKVMIDGEWSQNLSY